MHERLQSSRTAKLGLVAGVAAIALAVLIIVDRNHHQRDAGLIPTTATPSHSERNKGTVPVATGEALAQAFTAVHAGNSVDAVVAFDRAIQSRGFLALSPTRRYRAWKADAEAHETLGDHAKAHALFVLASESSQSEERAWLDRIATAYETSDYADVCHCLAIVVQRWPDALKQIHAQSIWMVQAELGDDANAERLRFELFTALYAAHWKDDIFDVSPAWRELTRMLLARNDLTMARQVAADVGDTRVALSMRVDKRFDAITTGNPRFDIDRLAATNLESARDVVARNPDQLWPRMLLMSRLLDATRYAEALRLADQTVAMTRDGAGPLSFRDFKDHYNWILDGRERALFRLGRVDEAVGELEQAARVREDGRTNVSQAINLGGLYDELGRPADALQAVSSVGDMAPYGRMQLELVALWASIQKHDTAAVTRHLTFMREHRADAMSA